MSVNLSAHTCFVSSNVFKNCVPVMIHSHINCTLFLHRSMVHTFLSVSLNCLHEMMQSNTGCICLTFLHCVFSASSNRLHPPLCVFKRVLKEGAKSHWLHLFDFSKVSSKRLPEKMHSHIDCICSTFHHCAFSNVSSNCLLKKRHNRTGYICLTFLHCVFKCLFKSPAREDAK